LRIIKQLGKKNSCLIKDRGIDEPEQIETGNQAKESPAKELIRKRGAKTQHTDYATRHEYVDEGQPQPAQAKERDQPDNKK